MVNITTTLTNFTGLSLVGKYDKLMSRDAIADPGEHMPGSKPGAARDLMMKIWNPPEPVFTKVKAIIEEHQPPLPGYAAPGLTAILISKDSLDFGAADLSAVRLSAIGRVVWLGLYCGRPFQATGATLFQAAWAGASTRDDPIQLNTRSQSAFGGPGARYAAANRADHVHAFLFNELAPVLILMVCLFSPQPPHRLPLPGQALCWPRQAGHSAPLDDRLLRL